MKTDVIKVDNQENGYEDVLLETRKAANYRGLSHKQAVQLQLIAEEMLSMLHSITGEMEASFWIESGKDNAFDMFLSAKTMLDRDERRQLIASASSGKNAAANSFLGKLRDIFENAMVPEPDYSVNDLPDDVINDLYNREIEDPVWDRYEQSILLRLTDNVKIDIRGQSVCMTVTKKFEE